MKLSTLSRMMWVTLLLLCLTGCSTVCGNYTKAHPVIVKEYITVPTPKPPTIKPYQLPIDIVSLNPQATADDKMQAMFESIIILESEVDKRDTILDQYRK